MQQQNILNKFPYYHWEMEQNTEEWDFIRLGKMTASCSAQFLVNGKSELGLGVGAVNYIYRKVGQLIEGKESKSFSGNMVTDRGHELEPLARMAYEESEFVEVKKVGFVQYNEMVGCSPDGLVGEFGGIEVKCLNAENFVKTYDLRAKLIEEGKSTSLIIPKDYLAQIQFNLFVTGRKWWDYVLYHPAFGDESLIVERVVPSPQVFDKFKKAVSLYESEVERLMKLLKRI